MFVDVLAIRILTYPSSVLLVLKTCIGCLGAAISGNSLLYPRSVSGCPRPERAVIIVQIIFLQNNLFIFNLLSACLHPHITTTHTTNQLPHSQRNPPPYAILLLFSLYILWYKTVFSTDPHCVRLYINKEKKRMPRDSLFKAVAAT